MLLRLQQLLARKVAPQPRQLRPKAKARKRKSQKNSLLPKKSKSVNSKRSRLTRLVWKWKLRLGGSTRTCCFG